MAKSAVFAPILAVYIFLFEKKRTLRNAIPAAVVCGGYWIFQLIFTWKVGDVSRIPAPNYWFTQPWVAMRYLFKFFVPAHLSADSDFPAFAHPWDPLAIAGYVGGAGLVVSGGPAGPQARLAHGVVRDLVVSDRPGCRTRPCRTGW